MPSKQKSKGKYFENRVANLVREALGLEINECTRAPNSGNGEFEFGDVFFSDPKANPYIFECKFGYKWDFRSIFPKLSSNLIAFLDEMDGARTKMEKKFGITPKFAGVILSKPYWPTYVLTKIQINDTISCVKTYDDKGNVVYVYDMDQLLGVLKRV